MQIPDHRLATPFRKLGKRGMTLIEVMISLTLLAVVVAGLISNFIQSRRITESSVIHAAATSLVYGLIEQMKGMDYTTLVPSTEIDADQATQDAFPGATAKGPPYIRVRINQDQVTWLQTVYTQAPSSPAAPDTTPGVAATAASLGAIDNTIGPLPLSTATSTTSQALTLTLWLWVDEMPDASKDVSEVKRVTLVYTYSYLDGTKTRTIRDREVFIRTRFDQ